MTTPISPSDDQARRRRLAAVPSAAAAPAVPAAPPARPPATLSHTMGEIAGDAFTGANMLEILSHGGRVHFRHYLWVLGGIDHLFLPGIMPGFLKSGPVADSLGFVAQASLTGTAASNLPAALSLLHDNVAAGVAAGRPSMWGALTKAAPAAAAVAGAPFNWLGAFYSIAVPAMTMSAIASSAEYFSAHGTRHMLSTKGGRGALLDALSGVGFIAQLALAGSPMATFGWVFGSAAQTIADANRKGWLGHDATEAPPNPTTEAAGQKP